jgi:hypothetical protein
MKVVLLNLIDSMRGANSIVLTWLARYAYATSGDRPSVSSTFGLRILAA